MKNDSVPRLRNLITDDPWSLSRSRLALLLTMIGAGALAGALQGLVQFPAENKGDSFVWERIEIYARFGLGTGIASGLALILSRNLLGRVLAALMLGALGESARIALHMIETCNPVDWTTTFDDVLRRCNTPVFLAAPVAAAMTLSAHVVRRMSVSLGGILGVIGISGLLGAQSQSIFYHYQMAQYLNDPWSVCLDYAKFFTPQWREGLILGWIGTVALFSLDLLSRTTTRGIIPTVAAGNVVVLSLLLFLGEFMPFTPPSSVEALAFGPEGTSLVTAHEGQTLRLWDVGSDPEDGDPPLRLRRQVRLSRTPAERLSFATDGRRILVTEGTGRIRLWNASTLTMADEVDYPGRRFQACASSKDGRCFAAVDDQKCIWLWRSGSEKHPLSTAPLILGDDQTRIWQIRFSADGRLLASIDHSDQVYLWETSGGTLRPESEVDRATSLWSGPEVLGFDRLPNLLAEWAPRDEIAVLRRLAVYPYDVSAPAGMIAFSRQRVVTLWDVCADRRIALMTIDGQPIRSLAFSPDARHLAIGGDQGHVKVVRLASSARASTRAGRPSD